MIIGFVVKYDDNEKRSAISLETLKNTFGRHSDILNEEF
jgi:hypothetical protein